MSAYLVDVWMSSPGLRSTIGTPTAENVDGLVELAYQLNLLSRAKNTWTSAAYLASNLRSDLPWSEEKPSNPFLLGPELLVFLRQIVDNDGLVLRELLREIVATGTQFRRDDMVEHFDEIVKRAVEAMKGMRISPTDVRKIWNLPNKFTRRRRRWRR